MTTSTKIEPVELVKALLMLLNEATWPNMGRDGAMKVTAITTSAERFLAQSVPVVEPEESEDE